MHVPTEFRLLPAAENDTTETLGKIPALSTTVVEPVGRWFEAFCLRRRHKQTLSHASTHSSSSEDEKEADDDVALDEENEDYLRTLDPKEWKSQDHYAVLGLTKLRWKATEDQIKRAYKQKVLTHHPDKRKARGLQVKEGDDDYFTCITRAYEQLNHRDKKRSFDSVDPTFDDSVPSANTESKENFYETFAPAFERNMRWSTKKKVPLLGDKNSTYDEINHFYSFWYDFQSWREFSYLDEEEKEKGENRDERRWIEKQNKAARQKRKKEEVARIRQLVDNSYACDPRIARFKEEEKAKKLAQKKAKQDMIRAKKEEEERVRQEALEEERKKKEKEEEEAKAQAAALKKEKEAQKRALKKERKTLRTKLKDYDYFASDDSERVTYMQEVDKLAEVLSLVSLQNLNDELTSGDEERAKKAFLGKVAELNAELEREKQEQLAALNKSSGAGAEGGSSSGKQAWSEQETALLIKAVNLFPAGTIHRWETVANFLTQHLPESKRSAKEVLTKAKSLQNPDMTMKDEVNKKAFDRFTQSHKTAASADKATASERFDSVVEQQVYEMGSNPAPWTADEQKKLEQALRTFPASTPDRWEQIAKVIPTRSKKDCMVRYKELVEMIRAKKAAQAATAAKAKK